MSDVDSKRKVAERISARVVAARVVERTLNDQAFLSDVLDTELRASALSPRDRALATELAYGVVRLERPLGESLRATR